MWARATEDTANPKTTNTTAVEDGSRAALPATTGRSLVLFEPPLTEGRFNDFINYARTRLSRDIDVSIPNPALVDDEPRYWQRYGVGLVPASAAELRPFLPNMKTQFGVSTVSDERYLQGDVNPSSGTVSQSKWALTATRVTQSSFNGTGINVAILDSGIATKHPAFTNRIVAADTFVKGYPVEDGFGHGTHIAGIACGGLPAHGDPRFGIAHDSNILVARVLADDGLGTDKSMIDGIEWAETHDADIVVMAFGGAVVKGMKHDPSVEKVMRTALAAGVLLIAESGNDSSQLAVSPVNSPANCPSVMAVGSIGPLVRGAYPPSYFSCGGVNIDGEVNVVAPGEIILSAWPPDTVRILEGTSQATAGAGGVAALLAEATKLRGLGLWKELERTAKPIGSSTMLVGTGLVQAP